MSLSSILLALFLLVFGVVTGFGLRFDYSHLVIGLLAIAAGVLIFCRR
jgi:hypothetical protein